jgi:uncharacterized transporter YbjL
MVVVAPMVTGTVTEMAWRLGLMRVLGILTGSVTVSASVVEVPETVTACTQDTAMAILARSSVYGYGYGFGYGYGCLTGYGHGNLWGVGLPYGECYGFGAGACRGGSPAA